MKPRQPLALCILIVALLCVITAAGCNVLGVLASRVAPEPLIPARFIPEHVPTVVIVENYHNPASLRLEADAIARAVGEQLAANGVAPIIDASELEAFRQSKGAAYRKMPLDAIARELNAFQVIYIDLERFEITQPVASEMLGGKAEARIRIVDETGAVLWPLDSAGGYPLAVNIEPQRAPLGNSPGAAEQALRQQLNETLADRAAKLFYNWQGDGSDQANEQFSYQ